MVAGNPEKVSERDAERRAAKKCAAVEFTEFSS